MTDISLESEECLQHPYCTLNILLRFVSEILDFNDLPSVFELISVTPTKEKWKTCIKNKIHEYWKMQIEQWSAGNAVRSDRFMIIFKKDL
jgi:hypothetical protein